MTDQLRANAFRSATYFATPVSYGVISKESLQPALEKVSETLRLLDLVDAAVRLDPLSRDSYRARASFHRVSPLGSDSLLWRRPDEVAADEIEKLKTEGYLPQVRQELREALALLTSALAVKPLKDLNVRGPVMERLIRNAFARSQFDAAHWAVRADETGDRNFELTRSEVAAYQERLRGESAGTALAWLWISAINLQLGLNYGEAEKQAAAGEKK